MNKGKGKGQAGWPVRLAALLAAAVILAVGLEALQIATQPKQYEENPSIIREAGEIDLEACETENAEIKNGSAAIGNGGGSLTVDFGEAREVECFQIWAKKHIRKELTFRVYYAGAGEDFSEERSVSLPADISLMAWEPAVPPGQYQKLRIETDGKISISRILYSEEISERVAVPEGMRFWRIVMLTPVLFALMMFLTHVHAGRRLSDMLHRAKAGLTESGRRTAAHTGLFVVAACAGYFLVKLACTGSLSGPMIWPRHLFCAAAGLAAASLITFRRTLGRKPEVLFVIVCLCAGSLMVFLYPETPLVSWDDEYHYDQALTWSYLGEERLTVQDAMNIIQDVDVNDSFLLGTPRDELMAKHQEQADMGVESVVSKPLEAKNIYEMFPAAGLYLARVLGLSYYWTYSLGKLFNLLAYTLCGFFAIRRLKSGKMLLAAVLLIPTSVFLASVYAYDPGLTAFTALGLAYCFAEWQERGQRMTRLHAGIMIGGLLFGCLTKAVYFPLLLIPMFLPGSKFRPAGEPASAGGLTRRQFLLLTAGAMLVLFATFMIPTLTGGAEGDSRGGGDVDAYGQISWVLGHPFQYAGILWSFLKDYLNPAHFWNVLNVFGYMGYGGYSDVLRWTLIALAFLDREKQHYSLEKSVWGRLGVLAGVLGGLVLVCTALYVMFTPVGLDWINGVQFRYQVPFLFPFFMALGFGWISRPLKLEIPWRRQAFNGIAFAACAFVLFYGVWNACIVWFV